MHHAASEHSADVTLDSLPDGSRIWVFAADRPFDADERANLDLLLRKVREKWAIKQAGMHGCHEFAEDRFLVVGADESREMLDGCSVDAMMSWVMRLEAETGLKLVDRMKIHYRDADGAAQTVSRARFAELAKSGGVTAETHVFDTTINRIEQWRGRRFEVPMAETWVGEAFG